VPCSLWNGNAVHPYEKISVMELFRKNNRKLDFKYLLFTGAPGELIQRMGWGPVPDEILLQNAMVKVRFWTDGGKNDDSWGVQTDRYQQPGYGEQLIPSGRDVSLPGTIREFSLLSPFLRFLR
jgi:hypothetical protein